MQETDTDCLAVKFTDYVFSRAEALKSQEKYSTADNYTCACRSFSRWIGDKECTLSALSDDMIRDYSRYLADTGVGRNSTSCYLRCLRAAYHHAVEEGLTPDNNPFRSAWTGVDKTIKRSVPEKLISEMRALELPMGSEMDFTRDLYIFSFSMRGMAFVDVAHLRRKDINSGTVKYTRKKTGQTLVIGLEPFLERIIRKYDAGGSEYVFPILRGDTTLAQRRSYLTALRSYNRNLKTLGGMLETPIRLTSYTARHSWATSARNHQVPIHVISAGLGHTSIRTTEIYIASLDDNDVDEANRELLKSIFHDTCTAPASVIVRQSNPPSIRK